MKHQIERKLTIRPNKHVKETIKHAMLQSYVKHNRPKRFGFSLAFPKPALVAGALVIILAGSLITNTILSSPLTAERAIAGAISALEDQERKGAWQFSKTREDITYFGGKQLTTFTESWYPTQSENKGPLNSSTKTVLEDGRVLNEYVYIDGKSYMSNSAEIYKELFGFDPAHPDSSTFPLVPGFKEAGLTIESLQTMSMKEIDDALIAVGQQPMNSPNYKTTDFPAYSMKPKELEELYQKFDELTKTNEKYFEDLYGGPDNFVQLPPEAYLPDGTKLEGEAATQYMNEVSDTMQSYNSFRDGTFSEKKDALEKMRTSKLLKFDENANWDGKRAVRISMENFGGVDIRSTQTIYLDHKTFSIIGEEFSYDFAEQSEMLNSQMSLIMPRYVKTTYLEQFTTDDQPTFSTDGLLSEEEYMRIIQSSEKGL